MFHGKGADYVDKARRNRTAKDVERDGRVNLHAKVECHDGHFASCRDEHEKKEAEKPVWWRYGRFLPYPESSVCLEISNQLIG